MSATPPSRPRRGLLVGGAGAVLGVAAVALGRTPAEAAAPSPLRLGRTNDAGRLGTALTTAAARTAWTVVQRGTGIGVSVTARATAVLGAAGLRTAWGVWGRNTATRAGTGGGVRAEGRRNAGLLADTVAQDVPALMAVGGDGTGVAQVATGQSYLDGDALALRGWTGVLAADGAHVAYAPVVSAETAAHVTAGTTTLDASGALDVTLPATFTAACDTTGLAVTVSPVGAPMPGLYVTYRVAAGGGYDGFTVSGGAPGGTVAWTAWATRRAVDLRRAAAGRTASVAETPSPAEAGSPPATRFSRTSLRLPAR
jgi:hypothetical protein